MQVVDSLYSQNHKVDHGNNNHSDIKRKTRNKSSTEESIRIVLEGLKRKSAIIDFKKIKYIFYFLRIIIQGIYPVYKGYYTILRP